MTERDLFSGWESTPMEAMTRAHRETVHSAILAWLLRSRDISLEARWDLLTAVAGPLACSPARLETRTEWGTAKAKRRACRLDILVEVSETARGVTSLVAIENKVKAGESDDQLRLYDESLKTDPRPVLAKVFLSFIGEQPRRDSGWHAVPYEKLLDGLTVLCSRVSNQYVQDYCNVVARLVASKRLVLGSSDHAECAFYGTRSSAPELAGFSEYLQGARLAVTLQRIWLNELGKRVASRCQDWRYGVGETNGAGLVSFFRDTQVNERPIRYGVQLQRGAVKVFAQPMHYQDSATLEERTAVARALSEISAVLGLKSSRQATSDRGRGFRSYRVHEENTSFERMEMTAWIDPIVDTLRRLRVGA